MMPTYLNPELDAQMRREADRDARAEEGETKVSASHPARQPP